jgi:RNA polymerase sigma factor (sigma-70 family)
VEPLIELVRRYQETLDEEVREECALKILEQIYPPLTLFIRSHARAENCEDILQECLVAIFKSLRAFHGGTDEMFLGFVYRIARNKIADSFRGRKMELRIEADPEILREALAPLFDEPSLSPDTVAVLNEALELLAASDYPCVGWLWQHYVLGFSFVEMGALEGVTSDAVRKRIGRCLALAQKLVKSKV